jgi:DNA-dependent RNA polymerase
MLIRNNLHKTITIVCKPMGKITDTAQKVTALVLYRSRSTALVPYRSRPTALVLYRNVYHRDPRLLEYVKTMPSSITTSEMTNPKSKDSLTRSPTITNTQQGPARKWKKLADMSSIIASNKPNPGQEKADAAAAAVPSSSAPTYRPSYTDAANHYVCERITDFIIRKSFNAEVKLIIQGVKDFIKEKSDPVDEAKKVIDLSMLLKETNKIIDDIIEYLKTTKIIPVTEKPKDKLQYFIVDNKYYLLNKEQENVIYKMLTDNNRLGADAEIKEKLIKTIINEVRNNNKFKAIFKEKVNKDELYKCMSASIQKSWRRFLGLAMNNKKKKITYITGAKIFGSRLIKDVFKLLYKDKCNIKHNYKRIMKSIKTEPKSVKKSVKAKIILLNLINLDVIFEDATHKRRSEIIDTYLIIKGKEETSLIFYLQIGDIILTILKAYDIIQTKDNSQKDKIDNSQKAKIDNSQVLITINNIQNIFYLGSIYKPLINLSQKTSNPVDISHDMHLDVHHESLKETFNICFGIDKILYDPFKQLMASMLKDNKPNYMVLETLYDISFDDKPNDLVFYAMNFSIIKGKPYKIRKEIGYNKMQVLRQILALSDNLTSETKNEITLYIEKLQKLTALLSRKERLQNKIQGRKYSILAFINDVNIYERFAYFYTEKTISSTGRIHNEGFGLAPQDKLVKSFLQLIQDSNFGNRVCSKRIFRLLRKMYADLPETLPQFISKTNEENLSIIKTQIENKEDLLKIVESTDNITLEELLQILYNNNFRGYTAMRIAGNIINYKLGNPFKVEVDATNSGYQVLSLIFKSINLAQACNLNTQPMKGVDQEIELELDMYSTCVKQLHSSISSIKTDIKSYKENSKNLKIIPDDNRWVFQRDDRIKFDKHGKFTSSHALCLNAYMRHARIFMKLINIPWITPLLNNRKLFKKAVMTTPYNITHFGMRQSIKDYLYKYLYNNFHIDYDPSEIHTLSLYLTDFFVKERNKYKQNKQYKDICETLAETGKVITCKTRFCRWFYGPRKREKSNVRLMTSGYQITYYKNTREIAKFKIKRTIPATFIHGGDAIIVHYFSIRMKSLLIEFFTIHDAFFVSSEYTLALKRVIKTAYALLYKDDYLTKFILRNINDVVIIKNIHTLIKDEVKERLLGYITKPNDLDYLVEPVNNDNFVKYK